MAEKYKLTDSSALPRDETFFNKFLTSRLIDDSKLPQWKRHLTALHEHFYATRSQNLDRFLVNTVTNEFREDASIPKIIPICGSSPDNTIKTTPLTLNQFHILQMLRYYHYYCCTAEKMRYDSGLAVVKVEELPIQRFYLDIDVDDGTDNNCKNQMVNIVEKIVSFFNQTFALPKRTVIITQKPNGKSFHIYIDVHVDFITRHFVMLYCHHLKSRNFIENFKIDNPCNMSLSCSRLHYPTYIFANDAIDWTGCDRFSEPMSLDEWFILSPLDTVQNFACFGLKTLEEMNNTVLAPDDFSTSSFVNPIIVKMFYSEIEGINDCHREMNILAYNSNLFDDMSKFEKTSDGVFSVLEHQTFCETSPLLTFSNISTMTNGHLECRAINKVNYNINFVQEIVKKYSMFQLKKNIHLNSVSLESAAFIPQERYEYARLFDIKNNILHDPRQDMIFQCKDVAVADDIETLFKKNPLNPNLLTENTSLHFSEFASFPFTKRQLGVLDFIEETPPFDEHIIDTFYKCVFKELFMCGGDDDYTWGLYLLCRHLGIFTRDFDIFEQVEGVVATMEDERPPQKKKKSNNDLPKTASVGNVLQFFDSQPISLKKRVVNVVLEATINVGSVTSVLKFLYTSKIFDHLIYYIFFLIKYLNITLHAKYILTYYATLPNVPTTFFSESFFNNDIMSSLFHKILDNHHSLGKKIFISMYEKEFSQNFFHYTQIVEKYASIVQFDYRRVFLKYICGLQSFKNSDFAMFNRGAYMQITESKLKNHIKYNFGLEDDYTEVLTEFSFFVNHVGIGLFNSPLNVYEFPGPSFKTLVSFKKIEVLEAPLLSNTFYPKFQSSVFSAYQKMVHFIKKCREDTLNICLLAPIFPDAIGRAYKEKIDPTYNALDAFTDSFVVTLSDFSKSPFIRTAHNINKNNLVWNVNFLQTLQNEDAKYPHLVYALKTLLLVFNFLTENYNVDFSSVADLICTLFMRNAASYLGLEKCVQIGVNSMAIVGCDIAASSTPMKTSQELFGDHQDDAATASDAPLTDPICFDDIFTSGDQRKTTMFYDYLLSQMQQIDHTEFRDDIIRRVLDVGSGGGGGDTENGSRPQVTWSCRGKRANISTRHDENSTYMNKSHFHNALIMFDATTTERLIPEYSIKFQEDISALQCIICLFSWMLRMGSSHQYKNTHFFEYLNEHRNTIYTEFKELIKSTSGQIFYCTNLNEMGNLIQAFCEQTTSSNTFDFNKDDNAPITFYYSYDDCDLKKYDTYHSPEEYSRILQQMRNLDEQMCQKYLTHVYRVAATIMAYTELVFDTLEDFIKMLISFQFKGNMHRCCYFFYGISSSLKTKMCNLIINNHQSIYTPIIPNVNLSRMPQQDFDATVFPMATNAVVVFDEACRINSERLKTLASGGNSTSRAIHGNELTTLPINAKMILTSNTQFGADYAAMIRLKCFKKEMQFSSMEDCLEPVNRLLLKHQASTTNDVTSPMIGAMILVNRFINWKPASIESSGLKLIQQYMTPLFFAQSFTPISNRNSHTMMLTQKEYILNNYPVLNFLSKIRIVPSENIMSASLFHEILSRWWSGNKTRFTIMDYKEQFFITEVCNYLSYFKQPCGGYKFAIENVDF